MLGTYRISFHASVAVAAAGTVFSDTMTLRAESSQYWESLTYSLKCVKKGSKSVVLSEILLELPRDSDIYNSFAEDPEATITAPVATVMDEEKLNSFKLIYWGNVCTWALFHCVYRCL